MNFFPLSLVRWAPLLIVGFIFYSCTDECETTHTYWTQIPVYETTEAIRSAFEIQEHRAINEPGRIYYKDGYVFINEVGKGFHVIDNRNPANPQKINFVNIPGNYDLAAKGDFMYADSYVDLLVLDISNPNDINQLNRLNSVFAGYHHYAHSFSEDRGILVEWKDSLVTVTETSPCDFGDDVDDIAVDFLFSADAASNITPGTESGLGGSLAKFTIYDNYLYTINENEMRLFDIAELDEPTQGEIIPLGWGIETIFPYGDKLFIGAVNGMHIYDNGNPEQPKHMSTYEHINSCDPVVVQGDYAYVTLRSGTECQGFTNQLDIVDISDLSSPRLFKTYPMDNPHGLGIDGSCLFITEGDYGLKYFDVSDLNNIKRINHDQSLHAIDVIPLNDVLMVIGNNGFHQYRYDCVNEQFEYLSTIDVELL